MKSQSMKLQTNRLLLIPLNLDLIDAAARQDTGAVEAMGYKSNGEWPGPDFLEALPYFREQLIRNNGTRGFDSWIIVEQDTQEIVGGIGFTGDPDPDGRIELGFATNDSRRRKGYCYEAAQALLEWAQKHEEVRLITARCGHDNIGSKRVLSKLGFQADSQDEELIYWIYPASKG
ncbi:GNAT family N-acetyltransferase [Paenibacillus mucilaginosus]|uniref:YjdG n=1 Tax=Paenibacillus mucilaginosus (strain KNP414) TaxID=1036673 RepID=F8FD86_PAEMK|nr:GNAT family N-acetyltransferase [Paenibacillus mucilaginosus]AEI41746.1 YjdG [Paenibacillus mucilaginosus KNP414]MCG7214436.1 GNAT family N-acetyltransferase [Paenibacillus mucilaginosus]WDM30720.1 GNAT family N-acetyltransferase [Paenibacillus mucilaginosus]